MRRIINNLIYDTDKAKFVGEEVHKEPDSDIVVSQKLYRKKTGEYFFHLEVHAGTFDHSEIMPVSYSIARSWAFNYAEIPVFSKEFQTQTDPGSTSTAGFTVSATVMQALREEARERKMSLSSLVGEILSDYVGKKRMGIMWLTQQDDK